MKEEKGRKKEKNISCCFVSVVILVLVESSSIIKISDKEIEKSKGARTFIP